MTAAPPWKAADTDPGHALTELRRRFPGVCAWRGEFTGHWWALIRVRTGRHRLIEAATPAALTYLLDEALPPRPASHSQPRQVPDSPSVPHQYRPAQTGAPPRKRRATGRHARRPRAWGLLTT